MAVRECVFGWSFQCRSLVGATIQPLTRNSLISPLLLLSSSDSCFPALTLSVFQALSSGSSSSFIQLTAHLPPHPSAFLSIWFKKPKYQKLKIHTSSSGNYRIGCSEHLQPVPKTSDQMRNKTTVKKSENACPSYLLPTRISHSLVRAPDHSTDTWARGAHTRTSQG